MLHLKQAGIIHEDEKAARHRIAQAVRSAFLQSVYVVARDSFQYRGFPRA